MVILMPGIDDIMFEADLGRSEAMHFYNWYDEIPPSKRRDWREHVEEWKRRMAGIPSSAGAI